MRHAVIVVSAPRGDLVERTLFFESPMSQGAVFALLRKCLQAAEAEGREAAAEGKRRAEARRRAEAATASRRAERAAAREAREREASAKRAGREAARRLREAEARRRQDLRDARAWLKGEAVVGDPVRYQFVAKGRWHKGSLVEVGYHPGRGHLCKVRGDTGTRWVPAECVKRRPRGDR